MLRVLLLGFAALCLASANSDLESSILSDLDELLVDADPDIFEDVEEGAGDMSTLDDLGDDLGDDLEVEIRPELREARQKCRDSIPKPDHITPRNEVEQEFLTKAVLGNWYTKPTWQHAYEATMTKACKYWGIKGRLERLEEEFHAAFNQYWQTYDSNPVDAVNTLWQSTKPMYDRINRTRKKLPRSMPTYTKWADSKDSLAQAFKKVWTRLEKAVEWDTPKWPFDVALFEKAFFEAAHKRLLWGKLLEWYNRKRAEWFLRGAACLGQPGSCSQATVQQIIDDLPEIAVYQFRVWGAFYDQAWLLTTSSAIPNLNTDQACCDGFFRQLKEGPGCDVAKILRYSCKTSPACQTSTLNPAARGNQLPWTRSLITTGPRDAWVSPAGRPVDPHQFNGDLAACRKQSMCVQSQEFCFIPTCVASMMMTINGQHGHGFCKAVEMLEKYGTGQNGSSLLETDESEQDEVPSTPPLPSDPLQMTACEGCPWPQACEAQFRLDDSSSASSKAKQRQR